jgi:hypothetical protein
MIKTTLFDRIWTSPSVHRRSYGGAGYNYENAMRQIVVRVILLTRLVSNV